MLKSSVVFFVFIFFIVSCKSAKVSNSNIKNLSAKSIIKKMAKTSFDKKSVRASLTVKYYGKSELPNLKTSFRMLKDTAIWLSFSKFGFPVAKLLITQNRVQFYEKISKTYFDGNFDLISKKLGTDFDFYKVQNLFTGEPLLDLKEGKYVAQIQQNQYELTPKESLLFDISFWINPNNFKLIKEKIQHPQKDQNLTIVYKGFTNFDEFLFPKGFEIKAVDKKRKTVIDVNYKNVIFDTALRFPFKIPKSYKKIELK